MDEKLKFPIDRIPDSYLPEKVRQSGLGLFNPCFPPEEGTYRANRHPFSGTSQALGRWEL